MRKLSLLMLYLAALISCECPYEWDSNKPYYPNNNLTFHEEDMWGTWQSSDLKFGDKDVKEFVISRKRPGEANVNLQIPPHTERYNKTYKYVLDGKFLYFQSKYTDEYGKYDGPYKFRILEFYTCEVTLQDCWTGKKYTIACHSACNGF